MLPRNGGWSLTSKDFSGLKEPSKVDSNEFRVGSKNCFHFVH